MTSPLEDPDQDPVLLDVAVHGDALDDPAYRALLGLDDQADAEAEPAS